MQKMFICLLALTLPHFGQAMYKSFQNVTDTVNTELLRKKADSLADAKEIDQSNEFYNQLLAIYKNEGENDQLLTVINKISLNYLRVGNHVAANDIFLRNNYHSIAIKDSLILSDSYYYFAVSRHFAGDFKEGLAYAKKALAIKLSLIDKVDKYELSLNYNLIGVSYNQLGLNDEAIGCYQKYLAIIKDLPESDKVNLLIATAYNNLGIIYTEHLADHDRALEYYFKAVEIKKEVLGDGKPILAESYTNIGNVLMLTKPNEALQYIKKAIDIYELHFPKEHLNVLQAYNSVADCYYELKNYDMALHYLDEVVKNGTAHFGEQHYEVALAYSLKFAVHKAMSDKASAIKYGEKGLAIYKKHYPEGFEVARAYFKMAEFYSEEKELEKAITYVNEAINHCFVSGKKVDLEDVRFENIIDVEMLTQALELKAEVLPMINIDSGYQEAEELYAKIINLYSKVLKRYQSEYSNEYIRENLYSLVEKALSIEQQYDEQTYYQVQKSKNIFLKTLIKASAMKEDASPLPDSVYSKERKILKSIEAAENQLVRAKSEAESDKKEAVAQLFSLKRELAQVKDYIRINYSEYYELRYGEGVTKISEVQKYLRKGEEVLIEYLMGEESVYVFVITTEKLTVKRISRDEAFNESLAAYRAALYHPDLLKPSQADYESFLDASHYLYRQLLAPVASVIDGRRLIIIPDGELSLIPFESFLTEEGDRGQIDYHGLPYLIRKHVVSYSSSAAMYVADFKKKKKKPVLNNRMLAVAPSFKENLLAGIHKTDTIRSSLKPLNWTVGEVEYVSQYFDSQVYLNSEATEKVFRDKAGSSDIIHIASHAMVDDENPMHSKIAFSLDQRDTINDGYLHTFELYNCSIDADMIVLSACNTGFGKVVKGEGVLNLARGCFYTGCQSVVMSLWVANDRSTATLMNSFYSFLAEDQPKNVALRNAKLDYLANHEGLAAHPYYWSQFVLTGNTRQLGTTVTSYRTSYLVIGGLMLCFLVGFVTMSRMKRMKT
ncbi:MAG: CHAT domain-containing tetratricopeptide repeat protein [Bacteroidota bacterium]